MTETSPPETQTEIKTETGPPCRRLAVVLFNLGGPNSLEAIQPFLFNLFNDPAIIGAPKPVRWSLAQFISRRRAPITKGIYEQIGGKSPLLELTQDQAKVVRLELAQDRELDLEAAEVFVSMRYSDPFSGEVVAAVEAFAPDKIILLPLYPQYSTTTTRSSLRDWKQAATKAGLRIPTQAVCCYPTEPSFIQSHVDLLRNALDEFGVGDKVRVLFSAHGLPQSIVDKGDPYEWQVEQTASAVVKSLVNDRGRKGLDWRVCYQSKVTPQPWLGPSTEEEIARAGEEGASIVLLPIAFVSEHSETLVELDIEYAELASEAGVPRYVRVPALGRHYRFVEALSGIIRRMVQGKLEGAQCASSGERLCPKKFGQCPMAIGTGVGRAEDLGAGQGADQGENIQGAENG
jgi:ferrochelatase